MVHPSPDGHCVLVEHPHAGHGLACVGDPRSGPLHQGDETGRRTVRDRTAVETLAAANNVARQRPERASFVQARQIYTYAPGAIYELYANPNFISAILLEPGESLNDVAAGDTSRWMVQETNAEGQIDGRTVVLVKPQATGLRTNIVLVTLLVVPSAMLLGAIFLGEAVSARDMAGLLVIGAGLALIDGRLLQQMIRWGRQS